MNQGEMILTPEDAELLLRVVHNYYCADGDLPAWHQLRARIFACAALVLPPLNGDKVWTGLTTDIIRPGQTPTVVRARSKAEAIRLLQAARERISAGWFANHWSVTGNCEQLCAAKERGVYVKTPEGWIKK